MTETRPYLPAMRRDWMLPLYDPFTRLAGAPAAHGALLAAADLRPGQRVLEIGCGTGNVLLAAARRAPGLVLTGLDPDPRGLARARRKAGRAGVEIRLERGFADELPEPAGSVDRVLSAFMLHHVAPAERAGALREVARVLAPGGVFVLMDFDHDSRPGLLSRPLHRPGAHGNGHGGEHGSDHGGGGSVAELAAAGLAATPAGTGRSALFGGWAVYRAVAS